MINHVFLSPIHKPQNPPPSAIDSDTSETLKTITQSPLLTPLTLPQISLSLQQLTITYVPSSFYYTVILLKYMNHLTSVLDTTAIYSDRSHSL
jgi:hypothetical protein